MPYNIWCGGCNNHIGMGVRYNAEKTKVGMYYTTPIYQFRMKCHLCTNHFSMKTDPGNLDYVIVEGATRQERRWNPTENGQVVPDDKAVGKKLADDAMYKLEHVNKDMGKSAEIAPHITHIADIQDRVKDDYLANRKLRDQFRRKKKELLAKKNMDKKIQRKVGTELDLLDECPEDVKLAQLLSIQARKDAGQLRKEGRNILEATDIFQTAKLDQHTEPLTKKFCKKIASSSQTNLIRSKGFGTLRQKLQNSNQLGIIGKKNHEIPETRTDNDLKQQIYKESCSNTNQNDLKDKSSLALLACYSESSDE